MTSYLKELTILIPQAVPSAAGMNLVSHLWPTLWHQRDLHISWKEKEKSTYHRTHNSYYVPVFRKSNKWYMPLLPYKPYRQKFLHLEYPEFKIHSTAICCILPSCLCTISLYTYFLLFWVWDYAKKNCVKMLKAKIKTSLQGQQSWTDFLKHGRWLETVFSQCSSLSSLFSCWRNTACINW